MARKIRLSVDSLTLGDLILFEDACGGDLMTALTPVVVRDENGKAVPDPDDPKGRPLKQIKVNARSMVGLVYVALHKEDPTLTIEQVKALSLDELDFDLEDVEESTPDPTEPSENEPEPSD